MAFEIATLDAEVEAQFELAEPRQRQYRIDHVAPGAYDPETGSSDSVVTTTTAIGIPLPLDRSRDQNAIPQDIRNTRQVIKILFRGQDLRDSALAATDSIVDLTTDDRLGIVNIVRVPEVSPALITIYCETPRP